MAKIIRPNKDFPIFGGGSQADELKIFGTDTESTDITLLLTNTNAAEGWASGVDANGFPALSWFNAVGHTLSYITAYYLQNGIPEWVALQEYFIGSKAVASDGFTYVSKTDANAGNTPVGDSTNWRLAFLDSANTVVYTPTANYHPATKKYVDDSISAISTDGLLSTTNFFHAQDQKTNGTDGGASAAARQKRILNTILTNTISGASLSSSDITLPAGTYYFEASAPASLAGRHRLNLYNVSDAIDIKNGQTAYTSATTTGQNHSFVSDIFTIAATKNINLQHYTGIAIGSNGLGKFSGDAGVEVYADIKIWKVG